MKLSNRSWIIVFFLFAGIIYILHKNERKKEKQREFYPFNLKLLTAFSNDHFEEALKSCKSIGELYDTQYWGSGYMIAYLLKNDIPIERIIEFRDSCPFVILRNFNELKFPSFVQNLYEYRWKPIIISEVLKEVGKVLYFDSSVIFQHPSSWLIFMPDETFEEMYRKMDTQFSKCGIRQLYKAWHSIYSATHPNMLKYYNISEEIAKQNTMYAATILFATKKGIKIIEKWKKCALEKECMAPSESHRECDPKKLEKGEYSNCHRFDQSALAILLLLECSSDFNEFYENCPISFIEKLGAPPP